MPLNAGVNRAGLACTGDIHSWITPLPRFYYCGLPSMINSYREAWEKERRVGDKRRAEPFITLYRKLWESEQNAA